jgi:23S rRNA (cytidine1920-2'-O)/16S rRNA (cytidine1409-2'-O)-methyltransferase
VVRKRLDVAMVKRGLCETRSEATQLIENGVVLVSGVIADKASRLVADNDNILVATPKRFVSRGGEKLEHALDYFDINVQDRSVLDAGSSTGGFTDCVLQRGASRVAAFDVGRAQLHEKLRSDHRVSVHEGHNVRSITKDDLPFPCSLVVVDLSFISATKVLSALVSVVEAEPHHPRRELVVLVKPQFEAGRQEVSKGRGVITDPAIHQRTITEVGTYVQHLGCSVLGTVESPLKGADGNTEFLMHIECSTIEPEGL